MYALRVDDKGIDNEVKGRYVGWGKKMSSEIDLYDGNQK
jgi:hypothetical protein